MRHCFWHLLFQFDIFDILGQILWHLDVVYPSPLPFHSPHALVQKFESIELGSKASHLPEANKMVVVVDLLSGPRTKLSVF